MAAAMDQLRAESKSVNEEDIGRLSPARYEHINPYGKYRFAIEEGLSKSCLRPLRQPSEHQSTRRSLFFSPLLSEPHVRVFVKAHLLTQALGVKPPTFDE